MLSEYFPKVPYIFAKMRGVRCTWTAWLFLAPALAAAGDTPTPGAVIVNGTQMGKAVRAGIALNNPGERKIFILLKDGGMLSLEPLEKLEVPAAAKSRADFFIGAKKSLGKFRKAGQSLESALRRKYGGLSLPDTVEGTLVYPVGACLIETPEAFKWQRQGAGAARFELFPRSGNDPLLRIETGDSLLGRNRFETLLKSGHGYRWRVEQDGKRFESRFSLLDERKLQALSDCLQALAAAETADPSADRNSFGWLVIRVAALCELSLYYEARAAIREQSGQAEEGGGERRELLVQVRRLQRYGYLLRKP